MPFNPSNSAVWIELPAVEGFNAHANRCILVVIEINHRRRQPFSFAVRDDFRPADFV